jgi:CO/xanthine dehydrogenase Mo-binding subunit
MGMVPRAWSHAGSAKQWGVDPAVCRAKHGVVSAGSRQLSYGQLVDGAAAALPVPTPDSLLKDPKDFTLIGTPAHAAMEPMNCSVHLRKDGCDIWVGTQAPTQTQAVVAQVTGLPKDAVRIHNHLLGGGFGRRLELDGSVLAVRIAQHVDGPVKVVWSREEDIQHDMYRPY